MRKLRIFTAIVFLLVIGLLFIQKSNKISYKISKVKIGGAEFKLDIADNESLRALGLSGRKSLSSGEGMIFLFPKKDTYNFWMKGMYIPLDFIWVDGETITDISENVSPPKDINSEDLPRIKPVFPVDKVIEIKAGTIKSLGVKKGDIIEFIK